MTLSGFGKPSDLWAEPYELERIFIRQTSVELTVFYSTFDVHVLCSFKEYESDMSIVQVPIVLEKHLKS